MSRRSIHSLWNLLFGQRSFSCPKARRQFLGRNRVHFEALEDRRVLATLFVDPNVPASGNIFSKINDAVAAAHSGDTIKVVAGTYNESIDVNKSLTLIGGQIRAAGEPTGRSIVAAVGADPFGFALDANNVTVKNFTIQDHTVRGILTNASF